MCVFIQGTKGDPGLPGLPGPAGYLGQKGERVRKQRKNYKCLVSVQNYCFDFFLFFLFFLGCSWSWWTQRWPGVFHDIKYYLHDIMTLSKWGTVELKDAEGQKPVTHVHFRELQVPREWQENEETWWVIWCWKYIILISFDPAGQRRQLVSKKPGRIKLNILRE